VVAASLWAGSVALADAPPPAPFEGRVPSAQGLVLDGRPDEIAWATALAIPAEPLEGGPTPEVKVLAGQGCLWVAVTVAEDPGFAMGVRWMIAPDETTSAADAVALSYSPQDVRAPEFTVIGPRGRDRRAYRFDGRADVSRDDVWTIETCLALADLRLTAGDAPLRLAIAASGRVPNRVSFAPPDAAFRAPSAFARLAPSSAGWDLEGGPSAESLLERDARDRERMAAWTEFLNAGPTPASSPLGTPQEASYRRASTARPDLIALDLGYADWLRAQVTIPNRFATAQPFYDRAERGSGAMHEAVMGAVFNRPKTWILEGLLARPGEGTDYERVWRRVLDAEPRTSTAEASRAVARLFLDFRRMERWEDGEWATAAALFPSDVEVAAHSRWMKQWREYGGQELALRQRDARRDDLPRVRFATSRGAFTVELFEDDAPNTVKNFVWLGEAGAYQGLPVASHEPFRRVTVAEPGGTTSRWAIPTEITKRKPFRGSIAMAIDGPDSAWARFFVTTGTLPEVDGEVTVFGRVIEGQDVVEKLVPGDVIEKVEIVRKRPNVEYRPITVAGEPAPKPK
jgi:peptidyl-prolyl cis-trans isomerase B (cyclophilin B)